MSSRLKLSDGMGSPHGVAWLSVDVGRAGQTTLHLQVIDLDKRIPIGVCAASKNKRSASCSINNVSLVEDVMNLAWRQALRWFER